MINKFLIKSILCAGLLFTGMSAMAQQDPNYTFYRYNMNLVNPAYAGAHDGPEGRDAKNGAEIGLNIRSQWSGVDGAPETQSLFFGTGLGKNLGLGVSVINDKTFIESQTFAGVDISYRVILTEKSELYLGIKAGANSYDVNTAGLTTFGVIADPSLMNLEGNFSPNVGAGAYLKGESYFLSFSIPKILTPERIEQSNGIAQLGRNEIHMYLSAGYDIELDRGVIFKPSAMARYVNGAPLSIDLTGLVSFNDTFEIGVGYRINEGLSALAVISASDWLDFGYAYELSAESPISSGGSMGTHELFIKLGL
jgi:type IX secretion system PorP/SprF family membrane protein